VGPCPIRTLDIIDSNFHFATLSILSGKLIIAIFQSSVVELTPLDFARLERSWGRIIHLMFKLK